MNPNKQPKNPASIVSVCPLCGRILPQWRLHKHIRGEHWRLRHDVESAIQKEFPNWVEQEGACKRCWILYRGVVRVERFIKHFRFPKRGRRPVDLGNVQS